MTESMTIAIVQEIKRMEALGTGVDETPCPGDFMKKVATLDEQTKIGRQLLVGRVVDKERPWESFHGRPSVHASRRRFCASCLHSGLPRVARAKTQLPVSAIRVAWPTAPPLSGSSGRSSRRHRPACRPAQGQDIGNEDPFRRYILPTGAACSPLSLNGDQSDRILSGSSPLAPSTIGSIERCLSPGTR